MGTVALPLQHHRISTDIASYTSIYMYLLACIAGRLCINTASQCALAAVASFRGLTAPVSSLQGDTEARLGLPVTPFCDRRTVVVSTLQLRFIDMFLRPLMPHVSWAVGSALGQDLQAGLAHTVEHWTEHRCRTVT